MINIRNCSRELIEIQQNKERLEYIVDEIRSSNNWIVSDIKLDAQKKEVAKVEFKPLSVADYCKRVFDKAELTLLMSATILDSNTFCDGLGLAYNEVKVIQVGSDFPKENRPIVPLNTACLNRSNLGQDWCKTKIANTIDKIMTLHATHT